MSVNIVPRYTNVIERGSWHIDMDIKDLSFRRIKMSGLVKITRTSTLGNLQQLNCIYCIYTTVSMKEDIASK